MKKLGILFGIIIAICFSLSTTTANANTHIPNVIQYDNIEGPDLGVDITPTEDESSEISPFIKNAILSLDEKIREQELNKSYIVDFTNSTNTVMTKGYGIFSFGMTIFNILTNFLETIMSSLTLVAMLLYNVASTSFLSSVVNTSMDAIEKIVFQWNDPNAWMYKVLAIFGLMLLIKQLTARFNKIRSSKEILDIFIKTIVSCMIVFVIGRYGRPVMLHMEGLLSSALTDSFNINNSKEPIEIQNKELLFEVLQLQPFRIRHFGVADTSQIPPVEGISNEERVQQLLKNPSTSNGKKEYKDYNNKQITHNTGQAMQVFVVSLFFAIHRILLCIIFGAVSFLLMFMNACKYLLLSTAFFHLLFALLKRSSKAHFSWFANSLQWTVISSITYIIFNTFLLFMQKSIIFITSINSILLIVFDLFILCVGWFLLKFMLPKLIERLKETGGEKYIDLAKGIFTGKLSPKEMIENRKEEKENARANDASEENGKRKKKTSISPEESYDNVSEKSDDFVDEEQPKEEVDADKKDHLPGEEKNCDEETKQQEEFESKDEDELEKLGNLDMKDPKQENDELKERHVSFPEDDNLGDSDEQLKEEKEKKIQKKEERPEDDNTVSVEKGDVKKHIQKDEIESYNNNTEDIYTTLEEKSEKRDVREETPSSSLHEEDLLADRDEMD